MGKIAYINGFCPFQEEDVTIRVKCMPYNVIGAPAYVKVLDNMCESSSNCPYGENCPVANQAILWDDL